MGLDYQEILKEALFKDVDIKQPAPVITIQGRRILTKGNFITINGLPKSRKTTFMNFFIYSALSGKEFFDISVKIEPNDEILLIDTEQSVYDFSRQITFLKRLLRVEKLPSNFNAYLFRKYEPEIILNSIYELIKAKPPKLLFIDNLTELVLNPNDIPESKKVIQFLKRITSEFDICVINLLHLGKTNLQTLGNLGSLADRAAQSILKVVNDKDTGISTLSADMLRSDMFFNPISIAYDEAARGYIQTDQPQEKPQKNKFELKELTAQDHYNRLGAIFGQRPDYIYNEFVEAVKELYGVGTNLAKQKIIPFLVSAEFVISTKGIYTPNYKPKNK